jgi:uncharacterized protein (DUF1778 family)
MPRQSPILLRFELTEKKLIERAAALRKMPTSTWCRSLLLLAAKDIIRKPIQHAEI